MKLTCCQDHILTENICFVWSETSYSGDKKRGYLLACSRGWRKPEDTREQALLLSRFSRFYRNLASSVVHSSGTKQDGAVREGCQPLVHPHLRQPLPRRLHLPPHHLDPHQQQVGETFDKTVQTRFRLFCGFVHSKPEGRKTAIGTCQK